MKKLLTIMLAIAIVAMYTFGSIGTVFADGGGTSSSGITVNKTAGWVDPDTSTADVTLTIDNPKDIVIPKRTAKIVLVLDRSGSMDEQSHGIKKIDKLKQTLNGTSETDKGFIENALAIENADVQLAVVSYSYSARNDLGFTNDKDSLKSTVNSLSAGGGTNTQAGIHLAQQLLDQVTADYEFIIVLSDGVPTYSYRGTSAITADTGFNYDSNEWTSRITSFNYGWGKGTGNAYLFNNNYDHYESNSESYSIDDYSYVGETYSTSKEYGNGYYYYDDGQYYPLSSDRYGNLYIYWGFGYYQFIENGATIYSRQYVSTSSITNNGFGTVGEAYLAKEKGTTIFSIGYALGESNNDTQEEKRVAPLVMKSIASSDDKSFAADGSNLDSIFSAIRSDINDSTQGAGAYVTDVMGSSTETGEHYQFVADSLKVTYQADTNSVPVEMANAATYDPVTHTINWNVENTLLKKGLYKLTYKIHFDDYANMKGTNTEELSTVLSNNSAALHYKTSNGTWDNKDFPMPTLPVTQYTVHYLYSDDGKNYTEDTSKAMSHVAIVGCTDIAANSANGIITDGAVTGYNCAKVEYGTDKDNDNFNKQLKITNNKADNVINVYYNTNVISIPVKKVWNYPTTNYNAADQPESVTFTVYKG